jgi:uncharacterized protein (DUF58 family)
MIKEIWPWFAGIVVIVGVATGNGALAVLGFAVALACGAAVLWSRYSLRRVSYERVIPEDRAFPGEEIPVTLRLSNRKPLPLSWIEVRDAFPETMIDQDPEGDFRFMGQPNQLGIDWRASAGAYERISRSYTLRAPERGLYEIGPASLRSGDPFGLFPEQRNEDTASRIVVYPRTVDLGPQTIPSRRPYGENATGLRIFEDPARVAGLRDYRPDDPLRRIDWKATARTGRMQSRVYEPSSSQHLLVCLNTQTLQPAWAGYIPELFERSISVAASVAREAQERRYAVGLLATASYPELNARWRQPADTGDALSAVTYDREKRDRADALRFGPARAVDQGGIRIPPGRRPEQLIRVLEALAVITPFVLEPLSAMLDREEHRLAVGTTLVVVTAVMPDALAATLLRLHGRGHRIAVFSTSGDLWSDQLGRIDVRDMSWADPHAPGFARPAEPEPEEAQP